MELTYILDPRQGHGSCHELNWVDHTVTSRYILANLGSNAVYNNNNNNNTVKLLIQAPGFYENKCPIVLETRLYIKTSSTCHINFLCLYTVYVT